MSDLDLAGLAELLRAKADAPRKQSYWQGRIDEYVAQNAVSDVDFDAAWREVFPAPRSGAERGGS